LIVLILLHSSLKKKLLTVKQVFSRKANFFNFLKKIGKLNRDKHRSVSRIGHGLHLLQPEFKKVAFSDKIKVKKEEEENLYYCFLNYFIRVLHVILISSNLLCVRHYTSLNNH
jgi:hypothetical protein